MKINQSSFTFVRHLDICLVLLCIASSEPPVRCVPVALTGPHLAASRRFVPCMCSRRRSWSWSKYPGRTGRTPWCSTSPSPLVSWLHSASSPTLKESRRGHKISSAVRAPPWQLTRKWYRCRKKNTSVSIFLFDNKIITLLLPLFWLQVLYSKK